LHRSLVSLIVLNYESSKISSIVRECLKGILAINWRPLEIIFVDNGSKDDSFEQIINAARESAPKDIVLKFVKNASNLGFARGNNEGYKHIDPRSKYVGLVNNDLVPTPDSVEKLVQVLENEENIAGVQPKILSWDSRSIDSAGGFIGSWGVDALGRYMPRNLFSYPLYVSHLYGAFSIYRVDSIERVGGLFLPFFFMYGDDYELGIRLWHFGFQLAYIPVDGGRHYGTATGRQHAFVEYWGVRAQTAVLLMYSGLSKISVMRIVGLTFYTAFRFRKLAARAILDGIAAGNQLRRNIPQSMKRALYNVPVQRFSVAEWALSFTVFENVARRRVYSKIRQKPFP
jgi:GT2 family glycosyltransferase